MTESVVSTMPENKRFSERTPAVGADSGRLRTLPWPTAEGEGDCLLVGLHRAGPGTLVRNGTRYAMEPGDLLIAMSPRDDIRSVEDFAVFRVPCDLLGMPRTSIGRLTETHVSASTGIASLVSQFLTALTGAELGHAESGRRLALHAVDLLALLVSDLVGPAESDTAQAREHLLNRIRAHIGENLMDPDLSPESIAQAHFISVRYLHKLFQGEGTTVSSWIREQRLVACRRELGLPTGRRRTVASVAHQWGFASNSHFSRVFRRAYGMSPSEWRAAV